MQLSTESLQTAEPPLDNQTPRPEPNARNDVVPAAIVLLVMAVMLAAFVTMFIRDQKDLKRRLERSRLVRNGNDRIFARTLAAIEAQRLAESAERQRTTRQQQSLTLPVTPAEVAERQRRITRLY